MKVFTPYLLCLFLSCGLLMISCGSDSEKPKSEKAVYGSEGVIKLIGPAEFKERVEKGDALIIDVRTPGEVGQTGKIKGANVLNISKTDFGTRIKKMDPNRPTMVYCARGGRSQKAALMMEKAGFKDVYDLQGGIRAWLNKGYKAE